MTDFNIVTGGGGALFNFILLDSLIYNNTSYSMSSP